MKFTVYGRGRPAGALKIGTKPGGRSHLYHRDGGDLRDFKRAVANQAAMVWTPSSPTREPVEVSAAFYFARPRGHYGTGRNAETLKASAPEFPATRANGDADKLARSLLDALTGVCIHDDAQVVDLHIRKLFADDGPVRVEIELYAAQKEAA